MSRALLKINQHSLCFHHHCGIISIEGCVMGVIGDQIKKLREKSRLTQRQLAERLSVDGSTVAKWESTSSDPRPDMLPIIAKVFNVSIGQLYGDESKAVPKEMEVYPYQPGPEIRLPVFGEVPAGPAGVAEQHVEGYEVVPLQHVAHDINNFYWLRVRGSSMIEAGIADGGLVLVHKQETIEDNQVAIVMVDDEEATVKRVRVVDGTFVLVPMKRDMDPIIIPADRVKILGRVKLAQATF
jgi:repressor LexA